MKRLLVTAAFLWILSYGISQQFNTPLPAAWTTAVLIAVGSAMLPFAAMRWAYRELRPSARVMWLVLNLIVIAGLGTRYDMLIVALIAANASIWAAFAVSRRVSIRQLRGPANGS